MSTMVSRIICTEHNFKASVGRNVQFALDYYECPTCVAIADHEYRQQQNRAWAREEAAAWRGHPSICLCNACYDWQGEDEFYRMLEEEAARLSICEILSSNYCDHQAHSPMGFFSCTHSDCPHPGCLEEQAKEPPF